MRWPSSSAYAPARGSSTWKPPSRLPRTPGRARRIHYRMHPANVSCLTAARIDCCVLANNHVLDWGYTGLAETLDTLRREGIRTVGAGRDEAEAAAPATIDLSSGNRVVVFAFGMVSAGVPERLGGRLRTRGRKPAARSFRASSRAHRASSARREAQRRRDRGFPSLGRQLGVRGPPGAARIRTSADRHRGRRCRARPLLSPSERHRGPSRQARPLRLRRLPERLRRNRRTRIVQIRPRADVFPHDRCADGQAHTPAPDTNPDTPLSRQSRARRRGRAGSSGCSIAKVAGWAPASSVWLMKPWR